MEKNTFIEELEKLAQNEDVLMASREVNELKVRFDDYILEEERKDQVALLNAQAEGIAYDSIDFKPFKDAFYEIYSVYKAKRKEVIDAKNAVETENLKAKKTLMTQLKDVIENEENIGAAYGAYKEIHEKWKAIGDIPREQRDQIQQDYSRLLEVFFYNMKIYRELKDHDLKRNSQLKLAIVEQLEQLKNKQSIRDIETSLKTIQNEWEEVGPVANEEWEKLKDNYWASVREIYEKINLFYDERRTTLLENLEKKKAHLITTKAIIDAISSYDSVKTWEDATKNLLAIQENWKTIGFGPRKENEEVWQEFRAMCDDFFAKKKAFFGTIQEKFTKIGDQKQALVDQVIALKGSTDWKATGEKIVGLQKQWKTIGHAGQKLEQKLWSDFRGACDTFFNARQKHFEEQDKQLEVNLLAKQTIIQAVESYVVPEDKKQALADLKEFTTSFNTAGRVPLKDKDSNYLAFKKAIDSHYSKLKLEGQEKDQVFFQARIDTLSSSPEASRLFAKEKAEIRQQIEQLKGDILQYENNLGFFAKSKGADALRKDVEGKINHSKNKIDSLIRKLKMIPNE
jgi:hypothetical protein